MQTVVRRTAVALLVLGLSGCAGTRAAGDRPRPAIAADAPDRAGPSEIGPGVFFQPPTASPTGRWAALLPGASGLEIFGDGQHYFGVSRELAARGLSVLVIDYKRVYRAADDRPSVATGEKIAWALGRALDLARETGTLATGSEGVVIAWSLGAESVWPILADASRSQRLGVRGAAVYYPSHRSEEPVVVTRPLLVLAGQSDDVTPLAELLPLLPVGDPLLHLRIYPGAHHAFDVASIDPPRRVSLIPIIGPSGTFGYDAAAAAAAARELEAFLRRTVGP